MGEKAETGRVRASRVRRMTRGARRAVALRSVRNCLTMRSSRRGTKRRPGGLPARAHVQRRIQPALQFAQLVIHMDAQRLEGAGGGMDGKAQRRGTLRLRNDFGQLAPSSVNGPRGDDGAGDAAGVLFLAEAGDDLRQCAFVGGVDQIGGALARRLMRMSSGPSSRKEKPRAGSSNWKDETPRSSTTPSLRVPASSASMCENSPCTKREPAAEMRHQLLAARDGIGIAVDAQHAAIGGFQNGAGIAAAAEGAVDIMRAVLGREHRQHFVQHHGKMAAHASPRASLASRVRASPSRARAFGFDRRDSVRHPRSGTSATCRRRRCLSFSPACSIIAIGQAHAALLVDRQQLRARDHRVGFVVMRRREERIQRREARMQRVENASGRRLRARGSMKLGQMIDAGGVLRGEDMAIGRGNADPPFAVERPQDRRHERLAGHEKLLPPSRPRGLSERDDRLADRLQLKPLGQSGIAWDTLAGQSKSVGN